MTPRLLVALALSLLLAHPARAQDGSLLLDYRDRPLTEITSEIARAAGQPLLFDESLKGNATLAAPQKATPAEAMAILEAVLLMAGFAMLPTDSGVRKILPIADAVPGAPRQGPAALGEGDALVATILRLEWTQVEDIAAKLQHLVARQDVALAHAPTNSLILVGRESRLRRLIGLAKILDQARSEAELRIFALRYREAEELAPLLQEAFSRAIGRGALRLEADVRTNRLIVQSSPEQLAEVRQLLRRLDRAREVTGDLEVLPVLYRDAEELAKLLTNIGTTAATARRTGEGEGAVAETLAGRSFRIVADPHTGSLLVQADRETRGLVREVLAQLDLPPRQVHLDVAFFEVNTPREFAWGIDFFVPFGEPDGSTDTLGFVFSNPSGGGLRNEGSDADNLFVRVGREPMLVSIIDPNTGQPVNVLVPRETAVITASDRNVHAELKSRPSLLMLAGEEQEIVVGDNIPVPVSGAAASELTGLLTTSQNIERYDTGVTVRVRPTIGEVGDIQLELFVKIDEVVESATGNVEQVGPTLAQRTIESTLQLSDGQIAVVGMGVDQVRGESINKMPWIGDIPLIGTLFKRIQKSSRDRQIVMTVQARVLESPIDVEAEAIRMRTNFQRGQARQSPLLETSKQAPYTLRVASYRKPRLAETLVAELEAMDFDAYSAEWTWKQTTYHDVYVGAYDDVFDAITTARELEAVGLRAELIASTLREDRQAEVSGGTRAGRRLASGAP